MASLKRSLVLSFRRRLSNQSLERCSPRPQLGGVRFVQASAGFSLHEQGWSGARCSPAAAGLVERIVDPRQWALGSGEVIDRLQLPMGAGLSRVAVELQKGQLSRQSEPLRQVIIGLLFPAGAPNELKVIPESWQVLGCAGRTEMKYSVYVKPLPLRQSVGIEAK